MATQSSPGAKSKLPDILLFGMVIVAHLVGILIIACASPPAAPLQPPKILRMAWVGDATRAAPKPPAPQQQEARHRPARPTPTAAPHPRTPAVLAATTPAADTAPKDAPSPTQPVVPAPPNLPEQAAAANPPTPHGTGHEAAEPGPQFRPDYLANPKPEYPYLSRQLHEQGRVLLKVLISTDGRATEVVLHKSSGFDRLDSCAIRTVRQWRFVPARQGEAPVAASVIIPIDFTLSNSTT